MTLPKPNLSLITASEFVIPEVANRTALELMQNIEALNSGKYDKADIANTNSSIVLQVVHTLVNSFDVYSAPIDTLTNMTAMSITIDKKSSTSKLILQVMLNGEGQHHSMRFVIFKNGVEAPNGKNTSNNSAWNGYVAMPYDNDNISTMSNLNILYVDPTKGGTGKVTYSIACGSTSIIAFNYLLNRTVYKTGEYDYENTVSAMVITEVEAENDSHLAK